MMRTETESTDARHTVVLVDDSVDIRHLMQLQLESTGHFTVVGEAGDGASAIAVATALRPALVLLDISMPVMDGLEALPAIRAACPGTVVIMFTGFASRELTEKALSLGAAAVVSKGHDIRDVARQALGFLEPERKALAVPATNEADQQVFAQHLERFRDVFDGADIGLCTLTLTGRIARVNRYAQRLLSAEGEDPVGRYITSFVAPDDVAAITAAISVAAAGETAGDVEHRLTRDDVVVRSAVHTISDDNGTALYLVFQIQDVTAFRQTEAALASAEARFRLFVESLRDYAIFMLDRSGYVVSWNAGAERLKGYSESEIVGRHFSVFYTKEAREARHPDHELAIAAGEGRYHEQGWRVRKDGSRFLADVTITALHQQGELIGFGKVTRLVRDDAPPDSATDAPESEPA